VGVDEVSTRPVVTVRSRVHIIGSATSPQFRDRPSYTSAFIFHASTVITSLLPLSCDYQRSLQLRFRPFVRRPNRLEAALSNERVGSVSRRRTGWELLCEVLPGGAGRLTEHLDVGAHGEV
jgi:hypothetical protein